MNEKIRQLRLAAMAREKAEAAERAKLAAWYKTPEGRAFLEAEREKERETVQELLEMYRRAGFVGPMTRFMGKR
jgi:hypothetical protein